MRDVAILSAVRTPIGRAPKGALRAGVQTWLGPQKAIEGSAFRARSWLSTRNPLLPCIAMIPCHAQTTSPATPVDCAKENASLQAKLLDWPQCRFLSDSEVTDAQIDELVNHITGMGYKWTKCQKLFRKEGVDQFSQPY